MRTNFNLIKQLESWFFSRMWDVILKDGKKVQVTGSGVTVTIDGNGITVTGGGDITLGGSSVAILGSISHDTDLTGVSANDHHNQSHVLATGTALGPDHTISGTTDWEMAGLVINPEGGISPAGEYMNLTQGTGSATKVFDSTDDDSYWYTDLTYPTGGDDASIAAARARAAGVHVLVVDTAARAAGGSAARDLARHASGEYVRLNSLGSSEIAGAVRERVHGT